MAPVAETANGDHAGDVRRFHFGLLESIPRISDRIAFRISHEKPSSLLLANHLCWPRSLFNRGRGAERARRRSVTCRFDAAPSGSFSNRDFAQERKVRSGRAEG